MSTIDEAPIMAEAVDVGAPSKRFAWLDRLEHRLERIGERLNPILVKEARQALKSRQFTVTFTLLLISAWAWSILGAVMNMPEIYYSATGDEMLMGYYFVLGVPLLIIVPFTACRSLAIEREDGTFELLSITTLSSRQIVTGKLGSAILQMIVFYSALAPCIVFTYLLRGVDIITIVLLLFHTFLASIVFSAVGLMFAGLSGSRAWQMFLSVALLFVLIIATWGWFMAAFEIVDEIQEAYNLPEFWIGNALVVTMYGTYLAIAILAAAAQNSFASDNRSTRIRVAIVVQLILFIGWISWLWNLIAEPEFICVMLMLAALHLYAYGIFLTGESGVLSPRVKRSLPVSFLGRTLLTWLNPGSGTGYVFIVCNLAVLCVASYVALMVQQEFGLPKSRWSGRVAPAGRTFVSIALVFEYVTIYLGIGRLFLLLVPRRERYGIALPLAVHLLVAVFSIVVPYSIQSFSRTLMTAGYTRLQITNWAWTVSETLSRGMPFPEVPYVLAAVAFVVFVVNLIVAAREVEAVRLETPIRVKREDVEWALR